MDEKFLSKYRTLVKYFVISVFVISLTLVSGLASNHAQAICTRADPITGIALNDTDCDGLADTWESSGYNYNNAGPVEINFPLLGASPNQKDIFVEIDYLGHHVPRSTSISDLIYRYSIAPVWNPPGGGTGVDLHFYVDDNIPNQGDSCTHIWTTPTPSFDSIKNQYLGTVSDRGNTNYANIKLAKMHTFHYGLFVHTQCENPPSSGIAEVYGNDFVVSLGYPGWGLDSSGNTIGSVAQQESVMMHELGHNLNLLHGGNVNTNCKPNYLSVMNYMFEMPNIVSSRPLDYSRSTLNTLIENSLSEPVGIKTSTPAGLRSAFGPSPALLTNPLSNPTSPYYNPVNWDRIGGTTATGVTANINNIGISDCNFAASSETLYGFTDWSNLRFWGIGGTFANSTGPINTTGANAINTTAYINTTGTAHIPAKKTNGGPACDVQDPECTPAKIGLCDPDTDTCVSSPCDINDINCVVTPCDFNTTNCFIPPPCDPALDPECAVNRDRAHPDSTINDVRGQRVSEVTHINNIIQKLPDGNFVGQGSPNQIKSIFRDKLIASNDSALVSVATDRLENAILKLNEVKTEITAHIQPADTRDMLNAIINNLSEALQLQR